MSQNYLVELDDGTGNLETVEVSAENDTAAANAACDAMMRRNPQLDRALIVVITVSAV